MTTPKQAVLKILKEVPEGASFEDIQYQIYVRGKIEKALRESDEGKVTPHEEVMKRMSKWSGA